MKSLLIAVLALASSLIFANTALPQCQLQCFTPDPPGIRDRFGWSCAVDGIFAAVGAPRDDDEAPEAGVVYAFDLVDGEWIPAGKLYAWDAAPEDEFGRSVALEGDVLVVGSPYDDPMGSDSGSAYVFRRIGSVWLPEAKLVPGDGGAGHHFGESLAISGDAILVGAPQDDVGIGTAYVFRWNGGQWVQEARLDGSGLSSYCAAGKAVAIDGDWAMVGAPRRSRCYSFRYDGSTWAETQYFEHSGVSYVGRVVALSGDHAVVGDATTVRAYTRTGSTWDDEQLLDPGEAASMEGSRLVIGNPRDGDAGPNAGAIYVYTLYASTWARIGKATAENPASYEFFGKSVDLSGAVGFIGAAIDADLEDHTGTARVFAVEETWCHCRTGNVNADLGPIANTLFLNGGTGGWDRTLAVTEGDPIVGFMMKPPAGGIGKYVIHANLGAPGPGTPSPLPASVGTPCFEMFLGAGANPVAVWNNLGKTNLVGSSAYFGTPIANPPKATAVFLELPSGDATNLPAGTTITFQGIILDPGSESPKGGSVTNAVILRVE